MREFFNGLLTAEMTPKGRLAAGHCRGILTQSGMGKYVHVIAVGLQNTLVYRVNFLFRATFGLIPLLATLLIWRAIYAGEETGSAIQGYTLAQMTTYYLIVSLVDMLTAVTDDDWQIAADIREGTISQFLLKPVDYLAYRLCLFGSGRLVYTAVALVPVGLFAFFLRDFLVPPPSWISFVAFLVSVVLTGLLQFLISFTMAMLAFWVLEVSTFIFMLFAVEFLASGHLFPLDILPQSLLNVLIFTPFPYQMYFPVSLYLGRTTGSAILEGLAIQTLWVLLAGILARLVWERGVRRYGAYGG
jgi:ABC-2 type transport system permease protein